jgi:hypothetical protein
MIETSNLSSLENQGCCFCAAATFNNSGFLYEYAAPERVEFYMNTKLVVCRDCYWEPVDLAERTIGKHLDRVLVVISYWLVNR